MINNYIPGNFDSINELKVRLDIAGDNYVEIYQGDEIVYQKRIDQLLKKGLGIKEIFHEPFGS